MIVSSTSTCVWKDPFVLEHKFSRAPAPTHAHIRARDPTLNKNYARTRTQSRANKHTHPRAHKHTPQTMCASTRVQELGVQIVEPFSIIAIESIFDATQDSGRERPGGRERRAGG